MIDNSSKSLIYSINIGLSRYTVEMSEWIKALPDSYFVASLKGITIHFNKEEDLTAFKLAFNV